MVWTCPGQGQRVYWLENVRDAAAVGEIKDKEEI